MPSNGCKSVRSYWVRIRASGTIWPISSMEKENEFSSSAFPSTRHASTYQNFALVYLFFHTSFIHLGTWKYIWIHISILSRIKIRFCCFVRFIGLWKIILIFIHMQRVTLSASCAVKALCYKHEISFSYYVKLSWNGSKISHVKSKGN